MANICIGNEWEELCDHDFIEFLDYNMTVGQVEVLSINNDFNL